MGIENQEILKLGIGNEEAITLKPTIVKIDNIAIDEIEIKGKKNKKVVCIVKHPDASDFIKISTVKYESKGKLETTGLWVNLDSKNLLRKGTALAILMNFAKVEAIEQLKGKELQTVPDEKGYLCFKAY